MGSKVGIRVCQVGEHITLGISVSQVGEHVTLGICVSKVGEHITLGICVSQVGVHSWNNRGRGNLSITTGVRTLFVNPNLTKTGLCYRISSNNIGRRRLFFFFRTTRGRSFEGDDYYKLCSLEVVPKRFCFIIPLNKKWSIQINWTWASKFGPLINIQCQCPRRHNLNRQCSNLQDQTPRHVTGK